MVESSWPVRSKRAEPYGTVEGPVPGQGALGGPRWLLVWNRDPFGECCCWRGAVRRDAGTGQAIGATGSCARPGKHPWVTRADGEVVGFAHGAADALEHEDLVDRYGPGGGSRALAVVLEDLLLVDVDGQRALRDFARLAYTVPRDRILGVSTSPRGWHVWLDVPGWTQRALNRWMTEWLAGAGGWHGTDAERVGRRGFLVDVRTGANRYAVWPGSDPRRRWIPVGEFGGRITAAREAMDPGRLLGQDAGAKAPWALDAVGDEWLAGWVADNRGSAGEVSLEGLSPTGEDTDTDWTWAELERWLARLAGKAPGSGRNNLLNQVAFHSGARCVAAGWPVGVVRDRLIEAGESVGTHGVRATVDSGLGAGMASLVKQWQQQQPQQQQQPGKQG